MGQSCGDTMDGAAKPGWWRSARAPRTRAGPGHRQRRRTGPSAGPPAACRPQSPSVWRVWSWKGYESCSSPCSWVSQVLLPQRLTENRHHLLDGRFLVISSGRSDHAAFQVIGEDQQRHFPRSCSQGVDLLDHIQAVAIVLDHLLQPTDLAFHLAQALDEIVLVFLVAFASSYRHSGVSVIHTC